MNFKSQYWSDRRTFTYIVGGGGGGGGGGTGELSPWPSYIQDRITLFDKLYSEYEQFLSTRERKPIKVSLKILLLNKLSPCKSSHIRLVYIFKISYHRLPLISSSYNVIKTINSWSFLTVNSERRMPNCYKIYNTFETCFLVVHYTQYCMAVDTSICFYSFSSTTPLSI